MSLVFFAMPASLLHVEIAGGKLVAPDERVRKRLAQTSQGDGDIGPDYDAYVLCGLTLGLMRALRGYLSKRSALRAEGIEYGAAVEDVARAMEPALRDSIACDVAAKLRLLTAAPIFVIANPLPSHERNVAYLRRLKRQDLEATVAEAYETVCNGIAAGHAGTFIPQPHETLDPGGLTTRSRFYLLPPDEVAEEATLHTHMNADFGTIVLRDALEKIEARLTQL